MPDEQKKGLLSRIDPTVVTKAYHRHIGSRPALESVLLGGLLGYGGYKAAPWLVKKMIRIQNKLPGMAGQDPDHAAAEMEQSGEMDDVAKQVGLAGGALGVLYPLVRSGDFSGTPGDLVRSYIGGPSYDPTGAKRKDRSEAYRKKKLDAARDKHIPDYLKSASFQDALSHQRIPVNYSLDLIKSDPFLRDQDKFVASSLVEGAGDKSGLTNGQTIAQTALRAGVGFVPAFAFGKVMTGLAKLPEPEAKNLSLAGGLAGAIYNTGIIQEFLKK